ncbi:MAG TPA: GlsB/YeaQ/YmgE family stress response membrane protein [Lacipirellulaceae bacterium]|nr:GlsB/YeaQ/YmgE family stress response membrane protein [Lacipirellulaceae bacterium]
MNSSALRESTFALDLGHQATRHSFKKGTFMGIIAWLILGLISGFIASKLVNKQGEGMFMDIVLGIVGAVVGGYLAPVLGFGGISGVNAYSVLISVLGAILVLLVYHALVRRGSV